MATNNKQTSKSVATTASKQLRSPSTPAPAKKTAASALSQAPLKKRGK